MVHGRPCGLLVSALAVLGLVSGCGSGHGSGAASASGAGGTSTAPGASASAPGPSPSAPPPATTTTVTATAPERGASAAAPAGARCHTSELRASVGRNDPGAGQENFPVVLTNASTRTCTVYGHPGAAFLDASGRQLGADPERSTATRPVRVTLAPGRSAWAGLSFSNPEVSGARAATPVTLLVTPPDEHDPLRVRWTGGAVPVSGNASTVRLTALAAGTGP
ncbi:DUF4232 domain-containing protein [Streptomyces longwoodensis]|uniref:DUF4232 domain-containing protein n=1 Tax=Streptomyces longwoodensis TaxID=68231 RepID=UPI002DD9DE9A|nr:DUF4232 domain-containing protein [Streptomyces longwoodensis]WRY92057.1 DUF4232 domain-containing protein [Streptomyces longwoodensis]WUC56422.1 DUF4232 domain-containing protein [Streptomyces longwoodensis]